MSLKNQACIVGIYEHPTRKAPDKTIAQLHAEVAHGALADAGLSFRDIDGYACAGDAPGLGPLAMIDYMNLRVRHMDSTDTGGSASSTAIRALIRQLIAAENTRRPLSDSRIAELLADQGFVVARRTVAKYRESLRIASVAQRRSL